MKNNYPKKIKFINVSLPRAYKYLEILNTLMRLLPVIVTNERTDSASISADRRIASMALDGLICLHNSLLSITPRGIRATKKHGDSMLYEDTRWVNEHELTKLENKGIPKQMTSEDVEAATGISFNELASVQALIDSDTNQHETALINPKKYRCKSANEVGALSAWIKLEPNNPLSFSSTYLRAAHLGLPTDNFYYFANEILKDKTNKPGAVFNAKVKAFFEAKNKYGK